jgi:hypothetical protein
LSIRSGVKRPVDLEAGETCGGVVKKLHLGDRSSALGEPGEEVVVAGGGERAAILKANAWAEMEYVSDWVGGASGLG